MHNSATAKMYLNLRITVLVILPYAPALELRSLMDSADAANRHSTRGDLFQLVVGYMLILAVIWSPRPIGRPLYIIAVVFIAASIWISFDSGSAMGLRRKNFLRALWVPASSMLLAGAAVIIAIREQTLHPIGGFTLYLRSFW